jgi:hypothetical protein
MAIKTKDEEEEEGKFLHIPYTKVKEYRVGHVHMAVPFLKLQMSIKFCTGSLHQKVV